MKLHAAFALAAGLLVAANVPPPAPAPELEDLCGEWWLLSTEDAGRTDPGSEEFRMTVRADGRLTVKAGALVLSRGTLAAGRDGRVRWVDFERAGGGTLRGLYERVGDELTVCWAEAGRDRPAGLTPAGTQWVERWRRAGQRAVREGSR